MDDATAQRLAKLGAMPVDTGRLDSFLTAHIPRTSYRSNLWIRPMRLAIAACAMLVIGLVAVLILSNAQPVMADTQEMARFHEDLISGRVQAMHVESIDAANKALAQQWANSPQMPNVPNDHVMACCMRSVKNKKMACVLLQGSGEPVTMTVANASDVQFPAYPPITRNGMEFHVRASGALNMVMTLRDGKWVCLISKLPAQRLMDIAQSLQF
jgi:hypothetical protein